MPNTKIDKDFAENLGLSFGGCVRDLSSTLFDKQVAAAAGVKLNPLPFFDSVAKARFKACWAGALQAIAAWAALDGLPEYSSDEKLFRKTLFQMHRFADESLGKPLFSKISEGDIALYGRIRDDLMKMVFSHAATKEGMARAFIARVHGIQERDVPDSRVAALSPHIGMAAGLFTKLIGICLKAPEKRDAKAKA